MAPAALGAGQALPPVFVVGLPKCGTTSLQHALESAGFGAVHCYAPRPWGPSPEDRFIGPLMLKAVEQGRPPLALLPTWVNAVTQMDCWWVNWEERAPRAVAVFPQMAILEELDRAYPDAKFILNTRDVRRWLQSVNTYGRLREILIEADLPGLPRGVGMADSELESWFEEHSARVRRQFAGREGTSLLAVSLEDDDSVIRKSLEKFLGTSLTWGHHNATTWAK